MLSNDTFESPKTWKNELQCFVEAEKTNRWTLEAYANVVAKECVRKLIFILILMQDFEKKTRTNFD